MFRAMILFVLLATDFIGDGALILSINDTYFSRGFKVTGVLMEWVVLLQLFYLRCDTWTRCQIDNAAMAGQ